MTEFARFLLEQFEKPNGFPGPKEQMEALAYSRRELLDKAESAWKKFPMVLAPVGRALVDLGVSLKKSGPAFPGVWETLNELADKFVLALERVVKHDFLYFCESIKILMEEPLLDGADTEEEDDWLMTITESFFSLWRLEYMLLALQDLEVAVPFRPEEFESAKQRLAELEVIAEAIRVKRLVPIDEDAEWKEEQEGAKLLRSLHPWDPKVQDPDGGWITPVKLKWNGDVYEEEKEEEKK